MASSIPTEVLTISKNKRSLFWMFWYSHLEKLIASNFIAWTRLHLLIITPRFEREVSLFYYLVSIHTELTKSEVITKIYHSAIGIRHPSNKSQVFGYVCFNAAKVWLQLMWEWRNYVLSSLCSDSTDTKNLNAARKFGLKSWMDISVLSSH